MAVAAWPAAAVERGEDGIVSHVQSCSPRRLAHGGVFGNTLLRSFNCDIPFELAESVEGRFDRDDLARRSHGTQRRGS